MSALPPKAHWVSASGCPLSAKSGHMQCAPGCSVRRALHARDGYIRSHVGVHLSVPKKWSKVCADRGVQFELRSCLQCSEGRGERTCCEGSGGLSDPALENQWQGCASSTDLLKTCSLDRIFHGSNSRGTSTSSYALGTVSSVNWKP